MTIWIRDSISFVFNRLCAVPYQGDLCGGSYCSLRGQRGQRTLDTSRIEGTPHLHSVCEVVAVVLHEAHTRGERNISIPPETNV